MLAKHLRTCFQKKLFFFCWLLAFLNEGIKADEIKDHFGQEGLKALKTLEKQAVIARDENGYYKAAAKNKYAVFFL